MVVVFVFGFLVVGIGIVLILCFVLVGNIDLQLLVLVFIDFVDWYFEIMDVEGDIIYMVCDEQLCDFVFVIYDVEGELQVLIGVFFELGLEFLFIYLLQKVQFVVEILFDLIGLDGFVYCVVVVIFVFFGGGLCIQMVVLFLIGVDCIISQYFGIYIMIVFIIIFVVVLFICGFVIFIFCCFGQVEVMVMLIVVGDFWQCMIDFEFMIEVGCFNIVINMMFDCVDCLLVQCDCIVQYMCCFIGDVSYELCIFLVSVCGYVELYWMGVIKGEEDIVRVMECIEKEVICMGVFVEDLFVFVCLDEECELEIELFDLCFIVCDVVFDLCVVVFGWIVIVIDCIVEVMVLILLCEEL